MEKTGRFIKICEINWIIVPLIAFSGIITGILFFGNDILRHAGVAGCIVASFVLAFIAYAMPKKDIISLLVPMYAILIFNPWSGFSSGLTMQVLYSFTIIIIAYRLEKNFRN